MSLTLFYIVPTSQILFYVSDGVEGILLVLNNTADNREVIPLVYVFKLPSHTVI